MSIAVTDIYLSNSKTEHFHELETLIDVHLYDINPGQEGLEIDGLLNRVNDSDDTQPFGIVIAVDNSQSTLKKIWSLLYTAYKARKIKTILTRVSGESYIAYGVYPEITNPVAIYQLNSPAENYANSFFLPPVNKGLNGLLRRIIFSMTGFHPSTAGIILVKRDT